MKQIDYCVASVILYLLSSALSFLPLRIHALSGF
jgi:hypothetical protein